LWLVEFEWYEPKSARNAQERRLPFELAAEFFQAPVLERLDERRNYGEQRIVAIGRLRERYVVCVYTWRGTEDRPVRRIISLRPAKRRERNAYRQAYPEAD
jgi:uncharacterized DUF497 family protein